MQPIDCETIREALSARADVEATSDDIALAAAHLADCLGCRTFAGDMERLDRMVRIRPAEPVPSLLASVTAGARPASLGRGGWLRPALAWVAVVMLVQSLPALLFGEAAGTSPHLAALSAHSVPPSPSGSPTPRGNRTAPSDCCPSRRHWWPPPSSVSWPTSSPARAHRWPS